MLANLGTFLSILMLPILIYDALRGEGGCRPETFGKSILSYELGAVARTCTKKLRAVLGS